VYVRPGVRCTRVGYTGGKKLNPTYYSLGDHTESIEIVYDPKVVSYSELLDIFFDSHDPSSYRSTQYKSGLWYTTEAQKELALERKAHLEQTYNRRIKTTFEPANVFTLAEDYHQKYYLRGSHHFNSYEDMPLSDFINSNSASILNAIVGGETTVSNEVLKDLVLKSPDLPPELKDRVDSISARKDCLIS